MSEQPGCTNGFCWLRVEPLVGQHTNGPCNCLRDIPLPLQQAIKAKIARQHDRISEAQEAARTMYKLPMLIDQADEMLARWPWLEEA